MSAQIQVATLTSLIIASTDVSASALQPDQFIINFPTGKYSQASLYASTNDALIASPESIKYLGSAKSNNDNYIRENSFNKVERELHSYLQLNSNWDDEGALVPDASSVDMSIKFLSLLKTYQLPLPKPMLANDGEVCLYWKKQNFYIEIGFRENGLFTYLVDDFNIPFGESDCALDNFLRTKLYASLNNFQTI